MDGGYIAHYYGDYYDYYFGFMDYPEMASSFPR